MRIKPNWKAIKNDLGFWCMYIVAFMSFLSYQNLKTLFFYWLFITGAMIIAYKLVCPAEFKIFWTENWFKIEK